MQDPALAERLRRVLREDPQAAAADADIRLHLDGAPGCCACSDRQEEQRVDERPRRICQPRENELV